MSNRITTFPPVGYAVESVEGPMAGSKWFTYYVPRGDRTEVVLVGEWTSKTVPADQVQALVTASLEKSFEEDTAGLRTFAKKA
jgi:hypothetical protein